MEHQKLDTMFAPAERAPKEDVERQHRIFSAIPMMPEFLDSMPVIVLVLNKERQVVFSNRALAQFLRVDDTDSVRGRRPGELMRCIHASETEGGCGTTEFCRTCGVANAIMASQEGRSDIQECRITRGQNEGSLDFRVWTFPSGVSGEIFTLFAVVDITHEKRRRALERIFFHDILNMAVGMRGLTEIFKDIDPEDAEEVAGTIHSLSSNLIDEINAQRELAAAENGDLLVRSTTGSSRGLMGDVVAALENHEVAKDRLLRIDGNSENVEFTGDRALIRRVILNMTKNAAEACKPGETVTLGCRSAKGKIKFWVHNPNPMTREVQLQVFQRSFSTKGEGRGLGTYSMKFLSERYLNGTVEFETSPEGGTTFFATYPLHPGENGR